METSSRSCKGCGRRSFDSDPNTDHLVCTSCGILQDYDDFQIQTGGISGPSGSNIRVGTAGSGSIYSYKETKIYKAKKMIEDLVLKLELETKYGDVDRMVARVTDGEYGQGRWFPILIGACVYVVMRSVEKIVPVVRIADVVGCDYVELGRMINRVVDFLELELPEVDMAGALNQAIRNCRMFSGVPEGVIRKMLKQGVFLLQCSMKWYLTTGRKPLPIVAAVLLFVAELNRVEVKIDDLASELHVAVRTCKKRYRELAERLVKVAQVLPWGKDVTLKNIMKNAAFVIQYMELKSMSKGKDNSLEPIGFNMEDLLGDCLSRKAGYGFHSTDVENESQYFEFDPSRVLRIEGPDKLQLSHECLAMAYATYLDEFPVVKSSAERGGAHRRRRRREPDLRACREWWTGKSELSKKLLLEKIMEKDVGLNANPPCFDKGCLTYERRREKIKAAKLRIQRIMHPLTTGSEFGGSSLSKCAGKKRKRRQVEIDWEDFIIETLLLHQVREEEIEKGHYNVLLELYVFSDWNLK